MMMTEHVTGVRSAKTAPGRRSTALADRPTWQRIPCWVLTLNLTLLGVSPAFAQDEVDAFDALAYSSPELSASDGGAGVLTKETRIARTVRILRSTGPQPPKVPGLDLALDPPTSDRPIVSLARGANSAVQDSSGGGGGLPWWLWALIGAGAATAAMQLEFGDESDESEDDD